MTEASDTDFGFEVSASLVAKLAMAALGFVGTILFARVLGPTSFGAFYLLLALVHLSNRPVTGVATGAKKRFSEAGSHRPEIVGTLLLALLAFTALAAVGVTVGRGILVSYTGLDRAPSLFIVLFVTLTLFTSMTTLLTATGRVSVESVVNLFGSVLTFPLQLALVLAGLGVAGMAYGLAGATLIAALLAGYVLGVRPAIPSKQTVQSVWSFARYSMASRVVNKAYNRFDVLLLGVLFSSATVGYYEVAYKVTMPAVYLAATIQTGLMARVSNFHSKGHDKAVRGDLKNTAAFSSILALPLFFGALALAEPLVVTLYGSEYAPAAVLLVGLTLYQVIRTQTVPHQATLNGLDHPEKTLRIGILTLAFNVAVGVVLAISYGAVGVVIATVAAETVRYLMSAVALRGELDDSPLLTRGFGEQLVGSVMMYAALLVVLPAIEMQSWVELLAVVGVGASLYGGVLVVISPSVRVTARSVAATTHVHLLG